MDGGHSFLKCKMVRRPWSLAQMDNIQNKLMLCNDPLSLFNELFRLTEEESIKVFVSCFGYGGTKEIRPMQETQ
uniref:Uncharacterized protein n=1 Tax=Triticum urartu TaxID=4572 RepID=A0A8R7Q1S0_TRIUA